MTNPASKLLIFQRFLKGSALPALAAAFYASWTFRNKSGDKHPTDWISAFGVAYFFLMWFVSQFARVAKQIGDETRLENISTSVNAIREQLDRQAAKSATESPNPEFSDESNDPVATALGKEAQLAQQSGFTFSAVLTAAVAFEHAVRNFATRVDIRSEGVPLSRLIRELRQVLPPNVVEELQGLLFARNAIVHMSQTKVAESSGIDQRLQSFLWAIKFLSDFEHPGHGAT